MLDHYKYKLEWVGFPNTIRKVSGVYLIGNIYVGASKHIRKRILSHCSMASRDQHNNNGVSEYINDCISSKTPIRIELLSDNPFDELEFSKKYGFDKNRQIYYHQSFIK